MEFKPVQDIQSSLNIRLRVELHFGSLEDAILDRRAFSEMTFFNYIRTPITGNVTPILEEDLIMSIFPRPLKYIIAVLLFCFISFDISFVWKLCPKMISCE